MAVLRETVSPPCSKLRNKTGKKKKVKWNRGFSPPDQSHCQTPFLLIYSSGRMFHIQVGNGNCGFCLELCIPSAEMNNGSHFLAVSSTFNQPGSKIILSGLEINVPHKEEVPALPWCFYSLIHKFRQSPLNIAFLFWPFSSIDAIVREPIKD